MSATVDPPPPATRCPRCDAPLGPDQSWCLECGLAARTRLAPVPNWRTPLIAAGAVAAAAVVALIVAFVVLSGNDDAATVTTAPAATTQPTTTPAAAATPGASGTQAQLSALRTCLGAPAHPVAVFAPTAQLAQTQGGGTVAARFGRPKVELIVFPTPAQAQTGFKNAQDQLVSLQQQRPATFNALAARLQVLGNVLEVIMRGDLTPASNAKVTGCINAKP